jgi:Na+-transporting NADH:ubiquinone oxidoreductase subunit C
VASNESIKKVLTVAVSLCLVCSVVVSSAAVLLRDAQEANKARDMKRNILAAAGLLEKGATVEEQFENVETRVIDFETGTFTEAVDPAKYEQRKAAKAPGTSEALTAEEDIADIQRQEEYGLVYLVYEGDELSKVILPIRGYGLWSTLYGFLALEADLNTVAGIGFYEHGETPGLGGEVDNPLWKAKWEGKKVYDEDFADPALSVIKGQVEPGAPRARYRVDGLSGATLTTRGVDNIIQFWLGERGYSEFLSNLRQGEA